MATNRTTKAQTRTPKPRTSRSARPTHRWALALLALGLVVGASLPVLLVLQGHHEDATRIALAALEVIARLAEAALRHR